MENFFDSVQTNSPEEIYSINQKYFVDQNPLKVNLSLGGEFFQNHNRNLSRFSKFGSVELIFGEFCTISGMRGKSCLNIIQNEI